MSDYHGFTTGFHEYLWDQPGFADRPGKQSLVLPIAKLAGSWTALLGHFPRLAVRTSANVLKKIGFCGLGNNKGLSLRDTVEFLILSQTRTVVATPLRQHPPQSALSVLRKRVVPVIEEPEDVPQAES